MPALLDELRLKLQSHQALVGIVGLGYVGLPLARTVAQAGFPVLGFDNDVGKVAVLEQGNSYLHHLPPEDIRAMHALGFVATSDNGRLREPDVVILCLPTPLTEAREPDLSFVVTSVQAVAAQLRPGQLIVLESTTYPGTTREVVLPILEKAGLRVGHDFFLAYSPEREDPGNPTFATRNIPKVVGAVDAASLDLAVRFYRQVVLEVVPVSSAEVAEACKLLENTYRAVNIALVNELKMLYGRIDIDVWEVIEAAKTKPFGFQAFYPGPGLGGHCIPIDPFYLTWLARKYGMATRFIELAGEVNTSIPAYVVGVVADALNERARPVKASKVLLLGMAYKKDVDDTRESPGLVLLDLLERKGAIVNYHDPLIPALPPTRKYPKPRLTSVALSPEMLRAQDAVVIVTDHSTYDWPWIVAHGKLVVDTRNATRSVTLHRDRIIRA